MKPLRITIAILVASVLTLVSMLRRRAQNEHQKRRRHGDLQTELAAAQHAGDDGLLAARSSVKVIRDAHRPPVFDQRHHA